MSSKNEVSGIRPVFRESAVRNYLETGKEKDVLPRFLKRPLFGVLWGVSGLLVLGLVVLWQLPIPGFFSGVGTLVNTNALAENKNSNHQDAAYQNSPTVLLSLPQQSNLKVQVGETIQLKFDGNDTPIAGSIATIETNPAKIAALFRQANLAPDTFTPNGLTMEVKLATNGSGKLPQQGQTVTVQVQAGSYKVISLLPFMDWLIQ